jgi:hypothetical protein
MQLQSADFWWIPALALAAPYPYRDSSRSGGGCFARMLLQFARMSSRQKISTRRFAFGLGILLQQALS